VIAAGFARPESLEIGCFGYSGDTAEDVESGDVAESEPLIVVSAVVVGLGLEDGGRHGGVPVDHG
jgi:hypothetical protein